MLSYEEFGGRDNRIFHAKVRSVEEVIDAIIRELGGWLKASPDFKDLLLGDFLRYWVSAISCLSSTTQSTRTMCRRKSPHCVLKLNFDGASKGNPGPASFGCVICDHKGAFAKCCVGR